MTEEIPSKKRSGMSQTVREQKAKGFLLPSA
jgi:hypothetical protein